jgi:hypothetical protein
MTPPGSSKPPSVLRGVLCSISPGSIPSGERAIFPRLIPDSYRNQSSERMSNSVALKGKEIPLGMVHFLVSHWAHEPYLGYPIALSAEYALLPQRGHASAR